MAEVFLKILNMSISASYIVFAVLLLRLILKKAPKWTSVLLWGIAAVRLVCPFSISSVFSLIPSAEVVSPEIMMDRIPQINTGIPIMNNAINPIIEYSFTPDPATSANPLQLWIPTFAVAWIMGMFALTVYTVISYVRVKRRVQTAVLLRDNIYQSERVTSPFVLGVIKPRIYLPFDISDRDVEYVVAHEMAHVRRKDHLWKPLGFALLTLHWFNPLIWLGYVLLCRDIELACDERVIKTLGGEGRADYSEALINCSVNRKMVSACPLAFGEVGVKGRVRSVLNYKKPTFWIIIVAIILCMAVAVCFLTDPVIDTPDLVETDIVKLNAAQRNLMGRYPEYFGLDASNGLDVYVWQMAKNSYSFGLLPHSENGRDWIASELLTLKGIRAEEMRVILSTYNIDENEIYIIPWSNPISSYLSEWQIVTEGEDADAKMQAYVKYIREMIFDENILSGYDTPALIYAEPSLSWVTAYVPDVEIDGERLYDANNGEMLGNVSKITAAADIFDQLKDDYSGEFAYIAQDILQNNKAIYFVAPVYAVDGVALYYVLMQRDGDMVVVYGHYENGVKADFIRWIFEIDK